MGDESIELDAPLPGLATKATITFLGPKQGLLGRSKPVSRVEADHAELVLTFADRTEERELDLAGVDAFLAEVRAFQARVAARRVENEGEREEAAELAATRQERAAAIRPFCPYCSVPRQHRGRENLATSSAPDDLTVADTIPRLGYRPVEVYACPRCGSVELFFPAVLDHPLGG